MRDKIIVYEKPTCTKCREVNKILTESGVEFEKVNYYDHPLGEKKLRELIKKMK
ncbi:glutaredoxin domain-containing protein, partial [Acinetobacter baumannii]